jgi:hypothetical protein
MITMRASYEVMAVIQRQGMLLETSSTKSSYKPPRCLEVGRSKKVWSLAYTASGSTITLKIGKCLSSARSAV